WSMHTVERYPMLEITGSVCDLYLAIVAELTIYRLELVICLRCPVGWRFFTVYESAPHHNATVVSKCVCQHIGALGMSPLVIVWPGLPFRIGLYQKAPKIGNVTIYFLRFFFPPFVHFRIQRVGCF